MLKELKINNLALIEHLHVVLERDLTVLTGETGAGKSIFLQAIALLSGGRASSSWVRTSMDQAEVEALFELPDKKELFDDLAAMGIDSDGEILIKRVLSKQGKSRFYLNGGLSTARLISKVAESLISVASQHDHQQLLMPRFHLDFIDLVGELWSQRVNVAKLFSEWTTAKQEFDQLKRKEIDKEQRRDFLVFQVKEISQAELVAGEDVKLEEERKRLRSSDDLRQLGHKSYGQLLKAGEALAVARKNVESMANLDSQIDKVSEKIIEQSFLVEEYALDLREYVDQLPDDLRQLEVINQRIDLLQQLKRKYGYELDEVIAFGKKAEQELSGLAALDERLEKLSQVCASLEKKLIRCAQSLSADRRKVAAKLNKTIVNELQSLCFENALFEIVFKGDSTDEKSVADIGKTGWDRVEFMFSANPGEPLKPLAKIASGGELSRVMLALKCLLARKDLVETVVFDEVDSGIGGKAAEAVARKIKELARHHQVMCITHLPQIAACGQSHFMVEKGSINGRTQTSIASLSAEKRVEELARMLDGEAVSDQSLAFARELIARNAS